MNVSQYENHKFRDSDLPIFFHLDRISEESHKFWLHWHENPELLFVIRGSGFVKIDDAVISAEAGCVIAINSNKIHHISTTEPEISYYCLIIDKNFCDQYGFHVEDSYIQEKIIDPSLFESLYRIVREMNEKKPYYKTAVMGEVLQILLRLFRSYLVEDVAENMQGKNIDMVKNSITFIKKHCTENISVSDISDYIGYSKYYFCRTFKQVTGSTVNTYLNSLKMQQAYAFLKKDGLSVNETAVRCGFNDISYFTKIFKKYMHMLPSQVQKQMEDGSS